MCARNPPDVSLSVGGCAATVRVCGNLLRAVLHCCSSTCDAGSRTHTLLLPCAPETTPKHAPRDDAQILTSPSAPARAQTCGCLLQAAALAGNSLRVRGVLLRELLSSSGAFGLLLGGGGPGGEAGAAHALPHARFLPRCRAWHHAALQLHRFPTLRRCQHLRHRKDFRAYASKKKDSTADSFCTRRISQCSGCCSTTLHPCRMLLAACRSAGAFCAGCQGALGAAQRRGSRMRGGSRGALPGAQAHASVAPADHIFTLVACTNNKRSFVVDLLLGDVISASQITFGSCTHSGHALQHAPCHTWSAAYHISIDSIC